MSYRRSCCYCGTPLRGWGRRPLVCTSRKCRAAWRSDRQREKLRREQQRDAEYQSCRDAAAVAFQAHLEIDPGQQCAVLPVPHVDWQPAALSDARRQNFREFLRDAIASGFDGSAVGEPVHAPEPPVVLSAACATCGGKCCARGGDHAYISEDTIRQYRLQHPTATAEQIEAEYVARLPTQSLADSCIFHTDVGCALPRSMRSTTCNGFLCYEALKIVDRLLQPPPAVWLIAGMAADQVMKTRVLLTRGRDENACQEKDGRLVAMDRTADMTEVVASPTAIAADVAEAVDNQSAG